MDQVTLFPLSEEEVYRSLRPGLLRILDQNWADSSLLTFEKRQNYYSVLFDGSLAVRIKGGKHPYIELPAGGLEIPEGKKKKDNYIRVKLEKLSDACAYATYIEDAMQRIIDGIPKEFSCCSRYMECSDSIQCLMPDKDMAMRCGYRKVLMSGKVFYGKNRNIE